MAGRLTTRISPQRVFILLMTLSMIAFVLPRRITDRVDHAASFLLSPFSAPARQLSLAVVDKTEQAKEQPIDYETQKALQQQLLKSRNQIANLSRQRDQLQATLNAVMGLKQQIGIDRSALVMADVLAGDSTTWRRVISLDRGAAHGVRAGSVVLAPVFLDSSFDPVKDRELVVQWAVVGRIKSAGEKTSDLQLITDPDFSLPVHVTPRSESARWLAEGILQASGTGKIRVGMITVREHPLQVGDFVYAAARSGYLPTDMIVAVVSAVRPDDRNPLLWNIEAVPAVNLNTLDRVIIIDTGIQK